MYLKVIYLGLFSILISACNGSGGGSTAPSNDNPCTIDCDGGGDTGDNPSGVKIIYSDPNNINGDIFTYSDDWTHSWDKSEITKDASYVALADGTFELGRRNADTFDIGASLKAPYCNTSDTRIFAVATDSLEQSSSIRIIKIALNTVSIYDLDYSVSTPPLQGSIDFTLLETKEYVCENGLLTSDNGVIGANDTAILGRTPDNVNSQSDAWSIIGFKDSLLTNSINDFESGNNFTQVIYRNEFENLASPKFVRFNQSVANKFGYDSNASYQADFKVQRTFSGTTTGTVFGFSDGIIKKTLFFGLQKNLMVDKDNSTLTRAIFGIKSTDLDNTQGHLFWAIE